MPNNKSRKPATWGQLKAGQTAGRSRPRNGQKDPYNSAIALENWFDLIMEDADRLRPFIVTSASEGDLNGLGGNEGRLEGWLVRASDREDAIHRIVPSLKPNVLCVDAFDACRS